jgi:small GTP-binding protein
MNYDEKCQLLIIGDSSVGKTSILTRFTEDKFTTNYISTVGVDLFSKDEIFNNKKIRIKIWDTAGEERYRALTQGFFKSANGIIITYSVNDVDTFENLKYWIQSIHTNLGENDLVKIIIIGNKIDLDREVNFDDAKKYAEDNGYKYFETSAKSGKGVNESIRFLVQEIIDCQDKKNNVHHNNYNEKKISEKSSINQNIKSKDKEKKKKRCCC